MLPRTKKELEALSAFLDGELTKRQRAKLETSLQRDSGLRVALDSLQQTRALLRQAPQLKAPRNFTLTPEMVGIRAKPPRLVASMRLVSAMAAILFVMVVIGDLLTGGGRELAFVTSESADSVEVGAMDSAEMAAPAPANDAAPEMLDEAFVEEEADLADADEMPVDDSAADTSGQAAEELLGTATIGETAADSPGADADDATIEEPESMRTAPPGTATLEVALDDEQLAEDQARAMLPPEIAEGDGEKVGVAGAAPDQQPRQPSMLLLIVRIVEVGLALVAVSAGLVALATRRRGRAN